MDLRHRRHMEEIGRMGDCEFAPSRQFIDADKISRINPIGRAPGVLDRR